MGSKSMFRLSYYRWWKYGQQRIW